MAYSISVDDIVDRWRPLTAAETRVAETKIEDAVLLLDTLRPRLAALVAAGTIPDRLVTLAVFKAVKRALANPDDVGGQNISPEGAVAVTFRGSSTSSVQMTDLYFLPEDLADLDRAVAIVAGSSRAPRSRRLSAYDEPTPDLTILPRGN